MFGDRRRVMCGKEAREELLKGISLLADSVACTLGPQGRNVILQRVYSKSRVTKDGVSVANEFHLEHPVQDIGAQHIKEASQKTVDDAGDGTTTSTILARRMIESGMELIEKGATPVNLVRGIDIAIDKIVKNIKEVSIPVTLESSELDHVATISANNDPDMGKLVAGAVRAVGNGKVVMDYSKTDKDYIEVIEGTVWDQPIYSPEFITSEESEEIELDNPLILVSNFKFTSDKDLYPILEHAENINRNIFIICEELERSALVLALKAAHGADIKVAISRPPNVSNMRKFMLEDIAIITGGTNHNTAKGDTPSKINKLGSAEKVIVSRKNSAIIGGKGDPEEIEKRKKAIQENINNAEKGIDDRHKERLAKMFSGIASVYIGGQTEREMRGKKDMVEDAILATQSALEEGIVPGGGLTLINCRNKAPEDLEGDEARGYQLVMDSLYEPFNTIILNAGDSPVDILTSLNEGNRIGYNAKTKMFVEDMIEEGVIDPAKVTRCALQNAASVAKLLLTTDRVIYYAENHSPESIHVDPGNVR